MFKKLIALIGCLLIATNAYAGLITFDSTATLTRAWVNDSFYRIYNEFNGSVDSDNIQDGSILSGDFSTAVNPLVRDADNVGEYVYEGYNLPTSGASASATIAASPDDTNTAYVIRDADNTFHRRVRSLGSGCRTITSSIIVNLIISLSVLLVGIIS